MKSVKLLDTTLRDGSQGANISFTVQDKLNIAHRLDEFGIHYIEAGWPGSNPKDKAFFEKARKERWDNARLVAFGSTRRRNVAVQKDKNVQKLLCAETPAISIFGKTWLMHAAIALGIDSEENCQIIYDSVSFLKKAGREIIYDAEHFFDGYKDNPQYALKTLHTAIEAGADVIVLCDTNGGTLPHEIHTITAEVKNQCTHPIGIHCHNDGAVAVANTLCAVSAGAQHVQGTVNGFGERCGNANLIAIIPNMQLKMNIDCLSSKSVEQLSDLAAYVYEVANVTPRDEDPFVGKSAFAHKGGVHVSAFLKNPVTYEHIAPETVGNRRQILISDLSGKSTIRYKLQKYGGNEFNDTETNAVVEKVKELENNGYCYETAEASFELLVQKSLRTYPDFFRLCGLRVSIEKDGSGATRSEVSIRVSVNGNLEHTAAEGNGPVNALDSALRKALMNFYPEVNFMKLADYKVRVLSTEKRGTASRVRVLIESQCGEDRWYTVGVSENIIEASWEALADSFTYFLFKKKRTALQGIECAKMTVSEKETTYV